MTAPATPGRGAWPRGSLVHGAVRLVAYVLVLTAAGWLAGLWLGASEAPHPSTHLVRLLAEGEEGADVPQWPAVAAVDVSSGELGPAVRANGVTELEGRGALAAAQHVLTAWQRDVPPGWAERLGAIVVHSDGPGGWTAAMGRGDLPALHVDVDDLTQVTSPQVILHEFAHLVGSLDGDPTATVPLARDSQLCVPLCDEPLEERFTRRFWADVDVAGLPHPHAPGADEAARTRVEGDPDAFLYASAAYGPVEDFAVVLSAAILVGLRPSEYVSRPISDDVTFQQKHYWILDQPNLAAVVEATVAHRADLGPVPGPDGRVPPS